MSFDLGVWPESAAKSDKEAAELYQILCEDLPSVYDKLPNCHAINSFYRELTELHPEIDDIPEKEIDNTELCPWSVAFDRSDKHIHMCAVWSRAKYVEEIVLSLGKKHGLSVFNPQTGKLHLPNSDKAWWKFWS